MVAIVSVGAYKYTFALWLALFVCVGVGGGPECSHVDCDDDCILGGDFAATIVCSLGVVLSESSMASFCATLCCGMHYQFWHIYPIPT